jgi:hypothetical protein
MMTSHATSTETEAAKNVRRTVLLLMGISGRGKTRCYYISKGGRSIWVIRGLAIPRQCRPLSAVDPIATVVAAMQRTQRCANRVIRCNAKKQRTFFAVSDAQPYGTSMSGWGRTLGPSINQADGA